MRLFQQSVINKYLKGLDEKQVNEAWERFKSHFHNPAIQDNIRNSKEEEYQEGYVRDLFVDVLGYTLKPKPDYNFVLEKKNENDSKKADAAIVQGEKVIAVIELKGTGTADLGGKLESQAFGYKNNQRSAIYVITSNFEKIRFYIDHSVDFEPFNLFQLTREEFNLLWLCLSKENIFNGIPKQIKDESLIREEDVTKKLYKDYSLFKQVLFKDITANNREYEKLLLFKKTQKLLDRFLFIFFAEDKGLLPPNSVVEILNQWDKLKEMDAYQPLYNRFKLYFGYLNNGYKGKQYEIFAYNGGLFAPDELLDSLTITDNLLYNHCRVLCGYDYDTEVDTNILGHIFEHSLNQMEEFSALFDGSPFDKSKTKRKKDGIFYTPRFITKYIVENTIGELCQKKKLEFGLDSEAIVKIDTKKHRRIYQEKIQEYRKWLLNLTICDPACGSGAFLNQALEFLIEEHRLIDEMTALLFDDAMVLTDNVVEILENNIFGVDINEESVEIAKLSLWLHTAKVGRKLNDLSSNIKCGNSLINDPKLAGYLAFDWKKQFPQVFENGNDGFDIIIGNPPYGDYFTDSEKKFLLKSYSDSFSGTFDMYIFFFEVALRIVRPKGNIGFITANTFIDYAQFSGLRNMLIKENSIEQVIGLTDVFGDAVVDTAIVLLTKNKEQSDFFRGKVYKNNLTFLDKSDLLSISCKNLTSDRFFLKTNNKFDVQRFIAKFSNKLGKIIKITQGVTTGGNESFLNTKEYFLNQHIPETVLKKTLKGRAINRYKILDENEYILYSTKQVDQNIQEIVARFLESSKADLSEKRETKQGKIPWYCLHWPRDENDFNEPKLLIRQTASHIIGAFDPYRYYPIDTLHTLNLLIDIEDKERYLKFVLGLLNSKLFKFLYQWKLDEEGKVYPQIKKVNIEWLPIADFSLDETISIKVSSIIALSNTEESTRTAFLNYLSSQLNSKANINKLKNWDEFEFRNFINELRIINKKLGSKQLSKTEELDWMDIFEDKKAAIKNLKVQISQIDQEIDQLVYQLYELTPEEIAIVESQS